MKIIDIAICVNNNDPENLGRIRCVRYSSYTGEYERAMNYKNWDDKDLFTANPFLPININFIPEIGQAIKIINYNTDKDTVNCEYIAGPFINRHDFNSQNFASQIEKTSYGVINKHGKNIINENGKYVNPKSEGAFAKNSDFGIYGKYGSDVIFTENGLSIRGGKLITKKATTAKQRTDMVYQPLMAKKSSVLHLKKFDKTKELKNEEIITSTNNNYPINYIVEYDIDNFDNSNATIKYYIYKITKPYENLYTTNNDALMDAKLYDGHYILLNEDKNSIDATITKTTTNTIDTYVTIRNDLKTLHYKGLSDFNVLYSENDIHPFYFRPTQENKQRTLTNEQQINRNTIYKNISINETCGPQYGLVFKKSSVTTPVINNKKTIQLLKDTNSNSEQSFSSLRSDKMFLLTTDNKNPTTKPIDFEKLDAYDLTQENYLIDIEPNTYATVRGETLLEFLRIMYEVLTSHVHNINSPYSKLNFDPHIQMESLFKKLEGDLLNKFIRIN